MSSETDATVKSHEQNQPLKSLGKYLIERKLGQGGMGTVYLAKHTELKKLIALKVLPQDKAKNPILVRRFKAEAQAAAQLEHPNMVAVYDTGEADGYLYIAMEYVEGVDLFEQVKRGGVIPVKRSIDIIKQVASALQHAFEQNIVHRDIKPSNLLLRHDGVVKVTDLGLARSIDDTLETNITRAGTTVGTVDYMAPEQARNSKSADIRSDIYSLGCTWYQMLTGEPPFPDGSLTNKLQAHAIKPLPDPREKNENIPEGLFAVLQRMTAKKPEDRYQSPAELLDDLARSKLTKAAFSNEIFSDLSDYDIAATPNFLKGSQPDADQDEDAPPGDHLPRRRGRSHQHDEHDEHDELPPETNRRKSRIRDDHDNEPEESPPATTRKKNRLRDEATSLPLDDTQPLKYRQKSSQKSVDDDEFDDDDDDDAPSSSNRSSKRSNSTSQDDDPDEQSPSKRKRTPGLADDNKSTVSKPGKGVIGNGTVDKKLAKAGPKALPPKRQTLSSDNEDPPRLNLEPLKYVGIAAGVLAFLGGLGWLIVRYSDQGNLESNPFAAKAAAQPDAVAAATASPNPAESSGPASVTVNVVEVAKPAPVERAIGDYNIVKQPLPAWAAANPSDPRDLPMFSVGPGTNTATHFSNLDDALRATDKTGGIVRLSGNGPFLLSRVEINNAKKVVVSAATLQDQPLIIIKAEQPGSPTGLLLSNGSLDLRGLHFAADRPADGPAGSTAMISVAEGQLFVRNCSFTSTGSDTVPATAISFTSQQDSQTVPVIDPQVLLDHVTVRGNGLTGLQIDRTNADVVIQDSLLVTGTAAAIDVEGHLIAGIADSPTSKPRRTIRIMRSTLCARKQVLSLAAENTTRPPTTTIYFQDSICSAEGSGNTAVLVSAVRWPRVASTTSGWLTNLGWASKSSIYVGFERLLDLDTSSYKVADLETWQRVWGKNFEATQFQPIIWQEQLIPELSSILPHDFDTVKLPYRDVKTANGHLPGCTTSQLNVPGVISQSRLSAMGHRPKFPAIVLKPVNAPPTRKVDLMKEDLGSILNKNDWASGTGIVIEATGSGLRTMLTAKIKDRSVRIVFRQGDGAAPLRIQPRVHDKGNVDSAGLFSIDNGSLDLQSGFFEAPQSVKGTAPPWLISAKNASVALRGCQLQGPMLQDLEQHRGLIQWTTTPDRQPAAGAEPLFLTVKDCLLLSTGAGIRGDVSHGQVFLRNCIVAVRGNGIDLQPTRTGTSILPVIDLQHVTFSTSKPTIRVEAAAGNDPIASPMRMFVDYCAFAPPLEFKPGEASESAVLECVGPVRDQKQLEWWGNSNGVAKEVKSLMRQSGTEPITSASSWHAGWGESNDVRLLTGSKGLHLTNGLPTKWSNLKPASFILDPGSTGATWADGGRPVGADIRGVEDSILARKSTAEPKPGAANMQPKPGAPGPAGTKKNVGF